MMKYFDTHAHYHDSRFEDDVHEVLSALPDKGVLRCVCPGVDVATSEQEIALAEKYHFLYAAAGIHPHEAGEADEASFEQIEELLRHPKVVAVGEIGLDYHYDFSPRDVQQQVLRRQLEIARKHNLPVIIHDREAHEDCFNIVSEYPDVLGVFHCYSGSWEHAKRILNLGWYISFTGTITFKNARRVLETVRNMPADRIMVETDAPYMTPVPHRGKRNDSSYVSFICDKVAELRGITPEEAAELTLQNGNRFFGLE
jgi:TatD DNase family protein